MYAHTVPWRAQAWHCSPSMRCWRRTEIRSAPGHACCSYLSTRRSRHFQQRTCQRDMGVSVSSSLPLSSESLVSDMVVRSVEDMELRDLLKLVVGRSVGSEDQGRDGLEEGPSGCGVGGSDVGDGQA